jgi:hypothetical protein
VRKVFNKKNLFKIASFIVLSCILSITLVGIVVSNSSAANSKVIYQDNSLSVSYVRDYSEGITTYTIVHDNKTHIIDVSDNESENNRETPAFVWGLIGLGSILVIIVVILIAKVGRG